MTLDDNAGDHPAAADPAWLDSLSILLMRRRDLSAVLPLAVIVEEIAEWVELASGAEAWRKTANRSSLRADLDESVGAVGASLRSHVASRLTAFQAAFTHLATSPPAVLVQAPGMRTGVAWTNLLATAGALLDELKSDDAARASWDDLVAAVQDRTLARREYRPIAELLFEQLQRRGLDAERAFRNLASIVIRDPRAKVLGGRNVQSLDQRLAAARAFVSTPASVEPVAVWLGYQGRIHTPLAAGGVSFYDAQWAVPNAEHSGQDFPHRGELAELVRDGAIFNVPNLVDEEADVDTLVRVDLGSTTAGDAVSRAADIVDTILNVSIYNAGGLRLRLAQYGVIQAGRVGFIGLLAVHDQAGFPDDHHGERLTAEAIEQHGPRIAEALAREELPRFLAAAIQVQTTADHPFGRDMAMRKPSEADISSVIPLADRVVQHIAAYAAMTPDDLFTQLKQLWPHARWLTDLQNAAQMCLFDGSGRHSELLTELTREWYSRRPGRPWILFLADRAGDLLSVCSVEHERTWITRMFTSVSDHAVYVALIHEYTAEGDVLGQRRHRVRNALVHGNPASFAVVRSVREYAAFLGGSALSHGLEAFAEATSPAVALMARTDEFNAMQAGQDAASFWRTRIAAQQPSAADALP